MYTWGDEFAPKGRMMANTWQGEFPWQNLLLDGYERTSPVKAFPPNGYGLHDMAGNVWEWTCDYFTPGQADASDPVCCAVRNPRVTSPDQSYDTTTRGGSLPRLVIKGGSHLCAPNYCLRYRPAARQGQAVRHDQQPHRLPLHRRSGRTKVLRPTPGRLGGRTPPSRAEPTHGRAPNCGPPTSAIGC